MRPGDGLVWVTGASSGIGRALALRLARSGYRVAISARSADGLAEVAAEAAGRGIIAVPVDVTDREAVSAVVAGLENAHGPIGAAVLNAGTHRPTPATAFDAGEVRSIVEVNLMGVVHGVEAVLPGMLARKSGTLAVVSSVAGYRGLPTAAGYGASKAALINLAEALKLDLDPHGIRVALVNPGFVDTPLTAQNPFPMPFLVDVETAALRMQSGLEGGGFEIVFPRRFAYMLKLLRILPYRLYFPLVHRQTGL